MLDLLEPRYAAIGQRIIVLESNMDPLDSLESRYEVIGNRITALESTQPPVSGGNTHFEAVSSLPSVVGAWSLRDVSQWSERRNGTTTIIDYSQTLDSCRFIIPPRSNKGGGFMFRWGAYPWGIGDRLVVQHDYMLNENMFFSAVGKKFTNLCRGNQITYELGPQWQWSPAPHLLRCYLAKWEGRQERDEIASDVADPTRTYRGSGSGYNLNPGPESRFHYNNPQPHPTTFRASPNEWIRVTYELTNTGAGIRCKMWLASETTDPKLVIASPINPSVGFLVEPHTPITSMYFELDTSQEQVYAVDQPERWVAFRNLIVLSNVTGDSVLGGKPVRN